MMAQASLNICFIFLLAWIHSVYCRKLLAEVDFDDKTVHLNELRSWVVIDQVHGILGFALTGPACSSLGASELRIN
jgi:hypothetical protein